METATVTHDAISRPKQIRYGFFCAMGVLVWLSATLVLRLWGQYFFIPESRLSMGGMFLFSIAFLPPLIYFFLQKVQPQQQLEALLWLSIPSMLLDVDTTYFFAQAFPNLSPAAVGAFAAWLLWSYAIVLITGLAMSRSLSAPGTVLRP
ncbi:DUF5367 domain-containing protein [Microcoleus sp. FACHB-1515]|uniref:DUF5367 family protein n=1 Tax=Cyanophyceae TaxID=3028117 RepID=UPI0016864A27|nr:DUF5367 family protein [Microcoleus sp. FACHB-1515]MBD2090044.1 DUF5367 domain-containing protein [Microcoleus sp. FACHB-1515]